MITDNSGVSEQVLSLPKGGGGVNPIGDSFKADLFTGTGNFSIPLNVPEGRNKLTPQLSLSYSSGNGNSALGVGWQLPLFSITRKTSRGIPTYNNSKDTFFLNGADELVPVGNGLYKLRTEKYFAKIQMAPAPDGFPCWIITTKDGVRNLLGNTNDSRLADPDNPNRIFSWHISETLSPTFNKVSFQYYKEDKAGLDPNNERPYSQIYPASISYVNFDDVGQERFLYRIDFDYGQFDENGETNGDWSLRPDPFSAFRSGFEVRTLRQLQRILVKVHGAHPNADGYQLIRAYHLEYDPEPLSQLSLLKSILLQGYRLKEPVVGGRLEYDTSVNPAMTFGYTRFNVDDRRYEKLSASTGFLPDNSLGHPDVELVDLFGNGLPDILETKASETHYWRNTGNGTFSGPHNTINFPFLNRLSRGEVLLGDANGNGAADLIVMNDAGGGFFGNSYNGEWGHYVAFDKMPRRYKAESQSAFIDVNADGAIDLLSIDHRSVHYYTNEKTDSRARRDWHGPRKGELGSPDRSHDVLPLALDTLRFADMNGDGTMDMLSIFSRRIAYRPNIGNGRWGDEIVMANSPELERNYDPRRLFLTDINGSGFADLIYVAYDRVHYWINQSGNRWSDRQTIYYTPLAEPDSVRAVDIKGTGTAGLLWSYSYTGSRQSNYRYLDFTGGIKPLLLNTIKNGFGALTTVEYTPSTQYYLDDRRNGKEWELTLPFPVQVVSKVTTKDYITDRGKTLTYIYHNGYYDGENKEFRGFSLVEELEEGAPDVPGTLRKNWFHPGADQGIDGGPIDFSKDYFDDQQNLNPEVVIPPEISNKTDALRTLRGVPLRTELYGLDSPAHQQIPFAVNQNHYAVSEIDAAILNKPHGIYFPKSVETNVIKFEHDGAHPRRRRITQDYDAYGNVVEVRRQTNSLEKPDLTSPALTVITRHRHHHLDTANSPVDWNAPYALRYFVSGLIETIEEEAYTDGGVTRLKRLGHTRNYYDGDAFQGQPLEQLPVKGCLCRSEMLVFNDDLLAESYGSAEIPQSFLSDSGYAVETKDGQDWYWLQSSRFKIGDFGLPVASKDGRGHIQQIQYDDFDLVPYRIEDAAGSVKTAEFDYQAQQTAKVIDSNDNITLYSYDPCGRLIASATLGKKDANGNFEGDAPGHPSTMFDYHLATVDISSPLPISITHKKRRNHMGTDFLVSKEYYDGFGEVLQKRIQVDPGEFVGNVPADASEHWLVSGWQEYNHKGKPSLQYPPALDSTGLFRVTPEMIAAGGAQIKYDSLGRVVETINADHSRKRIVYKTWSSLQYDENDNAASALDANTPEDQQLLALLNDHLNTPSEMFHGADDRIEKQVQNVGNNLKHTTQYEYDALKRPIGVIDALDRRIMTVIYDFTGNILCLDHADSGKRLYFYDGSGNLVLRRDAKGHRLRAEFDSVNRPVRIWQLPALPDVDAAWHSPQKILRARYTYGDPNQVADKTVNRVGRVTECLDPAGRLSFEYDFKGNVVKKSRYFFDDSEPNILDKTWAMPGVDGRTLAAQSYLTQTRYNASNQPVAIYCPVEAPGAEQEIRIERNRVGLIKAVYHRPDAVQPAEHALIKEIAYDPRGNRRFVHCGNDVASQYDIDDHSLRLTHLTIGKFNSLSREFLGDPLLETRYDYDLVGNILHIERGGELGDRTYRYDPLNRLIQSEGIRLKTPQGGGNPVAEPFTHSYRYDAVGNTLVNEDFQNGKTMMYAAGTNRLLGYRDDGSAVVSQLFSYDANGNLTGTNRLNELTWDYTGQLSHVEIEAGFDARYFYDHQGQRVKKIVRKNNQTHTTLYISGIFEIHQTRDNTNITAHKTVTHFFTNIDRTAVYEVDLLANISKTTFLHADHIANTQMITDHAGAAINRFDYYPYGRFCIDPSTPIRFGFTGHEYDLETGLYYCGSRYYHPEIGKFIQPDPILPQYLSAKPAGGIFNPVNLNLYSYAGNNPIIHYDPKGQFIITALIIAGAIFAGGAILAGVGYAMQQSGNATVRTIGRVFESIGLGAMGAVLGFIGGALVGGLVGLVVGGLPGMIAGAMIGGITGAVAGAVHGALAGAYGIYDLGSATGWLAFFADTTWGLSGTTLGLIVAAFSGGDIDENISERSNHFAFENSFGAGSWGLSLGPYIFTGGEMTRELWDHETTHTLQSRIFGPIWTVTIIFFTVVSNLMGLFRLPGSNPGNVEPDEGPNWDNWINPWEVWAEEVEGDTPRGTRTPM